MSEKKFYDNQWSEENWKQKSDQITDQKMKKKPFGQGAGLQVDRGTVDKRLK